MTGVLEVGAASIAIAAFARSRHEKEQQEARVAADLYRRFFNAELLENSPDRASTSEPSQGLDVNALAAIRAIERYQKERKHWFLGLSSSSEHVGDTRTRVLEEMKQWFMTLSIDSQAATVVARRLDYCWQFLLHASSFESQNEISFVSTLGEVCRHLDRLYQNTVATETRGEAQISSLVGLGWELLQATWPVLMSSLQGETSEAGLWQLMQVEWTRRSRCDELLKALLRQRHLRALAGLEEEAPENFAKSLEEARREPDGLFSPEAAAAFLELCSCVDTFSYFLTALRPYQQLASAGGDAALCWLRRGLSHLLQELEKSMLQLRQARLAVMRVAKKRLQELAKRLDRVSQLELRWMQDLRRVDELHLDELQKRLAKVCAEVSGLSTAVREVELRAKAKEGLQQIASAFLSPDFQARCSLALPERLAADMRELAFKPSALALSE